MDGIKKSLLRKVAETAYKTAKKEADSACICVCYQPTMPQKVKSLKEKK